MKTIRISDTVWNGIVKRGKFGESPDDVLRRVFRIASENKPAGRFRTRQASRKMTAKVERDHLRVGFANGPSKEWPIPARTDKAAIRSIRDQAVRFAAENGATSGQQHAVMKALTAKGLHITK
jgi:negative regulator of replication initiation